MKVILQKDVPNLGDAGEIKDVADGYARNFLLPRKLVTLARAGTTRALNHQKQLIARKTEKRMREMTGVSEKVKGLDGLEIKVRVGAKEKLFGSVTAMQVAQALSEQGVQLDKRKIELGEKIRALGTYSIKVRLAESIIVPLTINIVADGDYVEEEAEFATADAQAEAAAEAAVLAERAKAERAAAIEAGETPDGEAGEASDSAESSESAEATPEA